MVTTVTNCKPSHLYKEEDGAGHAAGHAHKTSISPFTGFRTYLLNSEVSCTGPTLPRNLPVILHLVQLARSWAGSPGKGQIFGTITVTHYHNLIRLLTVPITTWQRRIILLTLRNPLFDVVNMNLKSFHSITWDAYSASFGGSFPLSQQFSLLHFCRGVKDYWMYQLGFEPHYLFFPLIVFKLTKI